MKYYFRLYAILSIMFIIPICYTLFVIYGRIATSNPVNTETRNLDTMRAGIRNIYRDSNGVENLSTKMLLDTKTIPDNMIQGKYINSLWGNVEVGNDNKSSFYITYKNVPLKYCADFILKSNTSFEKILINEKNVKSWSKIELQKECKSFNKITFFTQNNK